MDKSTLLEILENEFDDENASYMIFKFKSLSLREEIKIEADLIKKADCYDDMICHYYGASAVIDFVKNHTNINNEVIDEICYKMIDDAHQEYYEKAKRDLESAHKRLF